MKGQASAARGSPCPDRVRGRARDTSTCTHQHGRALGLAALAGALALLSGRAATADSTSGIDVALFRSSYDTGGVFGLEGARLMPRRDLSFKLAMGYSRSPIDVAVPGIADEGAEPILDYLVLLDMAFGMSITSRLAIGFDVGAYRTATGSGYGVRGRYEGGMIARPSTGLISLRSLSNIDPSADPDDDAAYLGDGLAGPLDARVGLKLGLFAGPHVALAAVGTVVLPFGEDQMLLGDRSLVYEPMLALEYRPQPLAQTRIVANVGVRLRKRTVLEAYDTSDPMATADDARVFLDVGSELVAGLGGTLEITPRILAAAEGQLLAPLPAAVGYGRCRRFDGRSCSSLDAGDYWAGAKRGDLTVLGTAGLMLRMSADVTANVMVGTGQLGARADDLRVTTALVWAPQPAGVAAPGRNDRDGDRIPDSVDACAEEPEDRDEFQDDDGCPDGDNDGDGFGDARDACALEPEDQDGFKDGDGCPERDNDEDGVLDTTDRCPGDVEDVDGFDDDDGCPDEDNDRDGIPDVADKCVNDAETVNAFEDEDGCPDVRATFSPEERVDRIDFKGQAIGFDAGNKLTPASRSLLVQAAAIIKARKLAIRIEVHVARGTKSKSTAAIKAQRPRDMQLATARARVVSELLVAQGVPAAQLQIAAHGSDALLPQVPPDDRSNDRVELLKVQVSP